MRTFVLLILCIYLNFFGEALSWISKQAVSRPEPISEEWEPSRIEVHSTIGSASVVLTEDDCYYIFPTCALAFGAWCKNGCFQSVNDVCDDYDYSFSDGYSEECLCARQVTVCNREASIKGNLLGCVKASFLPMPPPFYETLSTHIGVSIVPMQSSTYGNPLMRVVVKNNKSLSKFDVNYSGQTLPSETVYSTDGKNTIVISKDLTEDRICTRVLKVLNAETPNKAKMCFNRYGSPGSGRLKYDAAPDTLTISGIKVLYSRPAVVGAKSYSECKGPLCRKGFFLSGYICARDPTKKNSADQSVQSDDEKEVCNGSKLVISDDGSMECEDKSISLCPTGYLLKMRHIQDESSNLVCALNLPYFPEQYYIIVNDKPKFFKINVKKFVPYVLVKNRWVPAKRNALEVEYTEQDVLDTLEFVPEMMMYKRQEGDREVFYKYEEQRIFCLNSDLDGDGGCKKPFYDLESTTANGTNYVETVFSDLLGKAFFLPADSGNRQYSQNNCGGGFCYLPANPFQKNLCIFEKAHPQCFEYKAPLIKSRDEGTIGLPFNVSEVPKINELSKRQKCDLFMIEAIGSGSSGGEYVSGSSGEYFSITVGAAELLDAIKGNKVLLPVVGLGGTEVYKEGQDSTLYICDKLRSCSAKDKDISQCGYIPYDSSDYEVNQKSSMLQGSRLSGKNLRDGPKLVSDEGMVREVLASGKFWSDLVEKKRKDAHNKEYIAKHCKVLIAARGAKQRKEDEDFTQLGSEFEKLLIREMCIRSISGKKAHYVESLKLPYPNSLEGRVMYDSGESDRKLSKKQLFDGSKGSKTCTSLNYGRGGYPISVKRSVQGDKSKSIDSEILDGWPGMIRIQCQTLNKPEK